MAPRARMAPPALQAAWASRARTRRCPKIRKPTPASERGGFCAALCLVDFHDAERRTAVAPVGVAVVAVLFGVELTVPAVRVLGTGHLDFGFVFAELIALE